jgi:transcriptional regulator with XRE-family HTH domain
VTLTTTVTQAAARKLPLNQRIVWARRRKGISQEELAGRIGTSRRHMIRIEKGLHRPGPSFRTRISEATGQPQDFFEDDDEEAASMGASPNMLEVLYAQLGAALGKATA